MKGKGEKERYTHLNAEFQRIPENVSYDDTRNYILEALEFYQKHHAKQPTQNKNNPGKVR